LSKIRMLAIGAALAVVLVGSMAGPVMSDVEQPAYTVVSSQDDIEIRRYAPMIIAEVQVSGERGDATSKGFRLLADYIFGNNTVRRDIAMTSPVQQQGESQKIAMTAPVQQQASDRFWTISFVMPSEYTMQTLPKPNNDRVKIRKVPAKRYIAIRFSGRNTESNVSEHEAKLMAYISRNSIKVSGPAKYAFYNPPWTLPFFRRNEVMFEIAG